MKNKNKYPDYIQCFIDKYKIIKDKRFEEFLISYALIYKPISNIEITSPEILLLNFSELFLILYRKECNDNDLLKIASISRIAAHKVYKKMLEENKTNYNDKFLNLIK